MKWDVWTIAMTCYTRDGQGQQVGPHTVHLGKAELIKRDQPSGEDIATSNAGCLSAI